ncbi:hypothetical protein OAO01_01825 [Oligoflexia bacterium]|nr:hypothetical protein [Oligoflexia bacterium]
MRAKLFLVTLVVIFLGGIVGCDWHRRSRAPGYVRLGPIQKFLAPQTHEAEHSLLLRRDEKGLYAMSTLCTYDLSPLVLDRTGKTPFLKSIYSSSKYDMSGNVTSGPAKANLPYFELRLDSNKYGGKPDTLFVFIGPQVSRDWRLK